MHYRLIDLRYPKIIFNFVSLVKNNFRRRQIAVSGFASYGYVVASVRSTRGNHHTVPQ
ncbi:MAG: hypothetical protein IJM09_01025 [Neisseriaceae bacterium]|nr:hypothetical protein [Neisseriaceae bacterium]